ncbi:MAG: SHOCT domain-containing protein [Candidatus Hydrogenedentes bacterium]|nr:SHOCT domain-containing protein [Candidatus Hydrogenedentota bacterium]
MANRNVSEGRKAIYYIGGALSIIGVLTFFSVFISAASNFGDFSNFAERGRSQFMRAIIGMGAMAAGGVLMGIGRAGLAGSGVVLDPERGRKDLEPWSRMSGGMLKDTLDEAGINLGNVGTASKPDFADRLRKLHALHLDGILSQEEYEREKAELLDKE